MNEEKRLEKAERYRQGAAGEVKRQIKIGKRGEKYLSGAVGFAFIRVLRGKTPSNQTNRSRQQYGRSTRGQRGRQKDLEQQT